MTHFYFMNTNGLLNYYPENPELEPWANYSCAVGN